MAASLALQEGRWRAGRAFAEPRKRPGLQGPVDDAFMDRFLVVRPTGQAWSPAVGAWAAAALEQFLADWRAQFRGDARVKADTEVTDDDLRDSHLILWGDPGSNRLLARLARRLPIAWARQEIRVGRQSFPAGDHVPVLIAPNPLQPGRYVVVNSGHTFAAWNGTNARQTPRLPDWAVWSLATPGEPAVVTAGFFDETWRVKLQE